MKISIANFHKNPSSDRRVDARGQT